jgi:hypothetical protein
VADDFAERYGELLTGSYDCVDRIVLNAYYPLGHNAGGFRTWWRRWHGGSDADLDDAHLMRLPGRFARWVRAWAKANARLAGMAGRFCTMLDCVDTGFIPGGTLDELPLPSQIGATRTGGIDLNKPRSRAVLTAALALAVAPGGFTVAEFTAKVRDMTGQHGYTIRNAAYDLRKLLADKPGRTRRYFISPSAARIISALLTLREQVIAPLLAGVADPRIRRTPRHWTDIDRHYQALRLEMMALFADIGIACG